MPPEWPVPVEVPAQREQFRDAVRARYGETEAARYGMTPDAFEQAIAAVVVKYGSNFTDAEKLELIASLRAPELVLARACAAGNDAAWEDFVSRYRSELRRAARAIAGDDATGSELADGLYAELYGLPNREGRRVSKFDYYMGRGSLQGWLRTVLAQQWVNRYRAQAGDVSLDEQIEAGMPFAAPPAAAGTEPDPRLMEAIREGLTGLSAGERFLLASYYLDGQTLAAIGRQAGVHESTISRKLNRIAGSLRKRVRKRLEAGGIDARRCEEMLQELDVRDLNVNVGEALRQEKSIGSFQE